MNTRNIQHSILALFLVFNTFGCVTMKDPEQPSHSQRNWRSIWLHEDTGAALVLLPVFIVTYPLELLSQWELKQWDQKFARVTTGMSPADVKKIIGRPKSIQKAKNGKEIWNYGWPSAPIGIQVTFAQMKVTQFEKMPSPIF